ncbi:Tim17/Tim22/Tim23/Pmp24 family-domain-containing protein [Pyronema domesticum]|uniref:Similar to NADH-ubiquinone oxidoreductase 21.3 kDa subunit acc. no. P25710 n=1 Tax=Pyronema omphalodes (strain CBS 100304) TaxID=1076935 RepID=U4LMZ5_PYROM|nr:Tim17/Tim22/Tim23/Pmp24 family-domain-containing protein [Pyronema domesticum]CCX15594.1 Similar to NADH-ubiquinone oxidoreductase 21.3 kDa subunit; acc. no. P25710 [Pyronema omphalodes CBS 100304]
MTGGHFERKDAVGQGVKGTLIVGGVGAIMSGIQNSLSKQNIGAMGVITKTGATIGIFAAMGGSYMFVRNAAANLREKDDHWNPTIAGFVSGAVLGTRFRTMPAVLGYGAGLAVLLGTFDYTGGTLRGYFRDPDFDEITRKENIRKNRRRPFEETVEEIGEGRGIQGPGYEDRRRALLTEKYGIDFTNVERR